MATVAAGAAFASISREARPYPAYLLPRNGTGLLLFAAGYLGVNDGVHFARKAMTCVCVDTDSHRLTRMRRSYPAGWRFVRRDAFDFAVDAERNGRMWDAVSVDTFNGDATDRSLAMLDRWCALARKFVTATIFDQAPTVPDGWTASLFPRSSNGTSWLVLTRA